MKDRFLGISSNVLTTVNVLNWGFVAVFALVLVSSFPFASVMLAYLARKYTEQPVTPILNAMRLMIVLGLLASYPVHVILTRLRAVVATAQAGDPFVAANAKRLEAVGWALLAIQLLDLLFGLLTVSLALRHIDTAGWSPSVSGWISVLMIFVLARVFTIGTRMRDDLEMTV